MDDVVSFEAKQVRKAAEKNIAAIKSRFSKPHEFSIVDPSRYNHLSIQFFDKCKEILIAAGFLHLADIEDVSLRQQKPDPRTFIRVMLDQEKTTSVGIFQIKPNLMWSIAMFFLGFKLRKIYEFETEFSDGSFVTTTILPKSNLLPPCSKTPTFHHPPNTQILELYDKHKQNCLRHIQELSNRKPLIYRTIDDVEKSQNRQIKIKYEYYLSIGYLTLEWIERTTFDKKIAKKIYDEIQRIANEERKAMGL